MEQVVADAIAAGEVVERPASVVKELVENALDAGARTIQVEMDGGGLERILVVDDGCGISAADIGLAFTRHATSKVGSIADLARISSLGFRGEALASIAAVSRVECRSCCHGAAEAALINVDHGLAGTVGAAPPVPGTRVEVRGLFENTPARRAFLKRPATELAAAVRILAALALCHPQVRFRFSADGRRVLEVPGSGSVDRVYMTVSRARAGLLAVAASRGELLVSGVVAEPSGLRRSREHLYLAVNRRPVSSRSLAFAVEQAYRGLVEPGVFPAGALMLDVPPDLVDVNVHPTKREVRLRDERAAFSMVQEAVVRALSESGSYGGEGLLSNAGSDPVSTAPPAGWAAVLDSAAQLDFSPMRTTSSGDGSYLREGLGTSPGGDLVVKDTTAAVNSTNGVLAPILRGPFRLVGQVMDSYIVAEGPSGMVVVDQHAAHERVVYNRLASAGRERQMQPLLVPILLQLTPVQAACLDEARPDLLLAGLEIEEFGSGAARLVAYDPVLPKARLDRLAIEVLDTLVSEGREVDLHRRLERALYTVACHSAVRFGQRLSREEMEQLLRDLEVADPGITCPHGRPTLLEIPESRLRREFRRSPA
ncbi:MAG: DNA mismatch repair endonuclease MutL [Candidatus Dormibacteria bacterium]